jgi:hypothetical protein
MEAEGTGGKERKGKKGDEDRDIILNKPIQLWRFDTFRDVRT